MAQERISMRKIKEVLRLHYEAKLSNKKIAKIVSMGRRTVQRYLCKFQAAGLSWPLSQDVGEEALEAQLFPPQPNDVQKPELDYEYLLQESRKPNATKTILWEEYKQEHPNGYQYSQFCKLLHRYFNTKKCSMRQEHKAGERTFVDFGDSPLVITDPVTGTHTATKIFVSAWGASCYIYSKSSFTEELGDWIALNTNALEFFGCCPKAIVPDNLKSAVTKACKYEPDINPTYAEFARHYGMVIYPARPYRPKDKARAENAVKLVKRWILFRLRGRIFYSLAELNEAIQELLVYANNKIMKRFGKSRKELFTQWDKPHAQPLPALRYEFAQWKRAKVQSDYHVGFQGHSYSVPYAYIGKTIELRVTQHIVELYFRGQRIHSHARSNDPHGATTVTAHMPPNHQKYLEWTPERILAHAARYGSAVEELVKKIMESRKLPEQAYKSCLGIIRLESQFSAQRLNLACQRALAYQAYSYQYVVNILQKGLEKQQASVITLPYLVTHENIRGAEYFT